MPSGPPSAGAVPPTPSGPWPMLFATAGSGWMSSPCSRSPAHWRVANCWRPRGSLSCWPAGGPWGRGQRGGARGARPARWGGGRGRARGDRDPALETVPLDAVIPGDLLLVAPGELVPVDGTVAGGTAVLDESALSGEARPVERAPREPVRSGVVNAGGPFDLRVTAAAADSTYAGIVRLVSEAEASQAPFVRLADRYAVWFLVLSLAGAGVAWLVAGAARAVAVLVVATPCPLILAAPVALVSGLSVAARRGVVVKGGGVLERLARCTTLLLD